MYNSGVYRVSLRVYNRVYIPGIPQGGVYTGVSLRVVYMRGIPQGGVHAGYVPQGGTRVGVPQGGTRVGVYLRVCVGGVYLRV